MFNRHHIFVKAFTLIELSIVLVIIGLVIGGVLVGKDVVRSARIRATVTQIEQYNTAVNNFHGKYNSNLPGDIPNNDATAFGFAARGQYAGQGDGNGMLEGNSNNQAGQDYGTHQATGETAMFWVDLSAVHMIRDTFNTATSSTIPAGTISGSSILQYLPQASLGNGNYIYVYSFASGGATYNQAGPLAYKNYFGISAPSSITKYGVMTSTGGMTPNEAYAMDNKIDDGLPFSGNVVALYINTGFVWSGTSYGQGQTGMGTILGSSTTCFDNNGSTSNTLQYSVEQSGGDNETCGLSFAFQ